MAITHFEFDLRIDEDMAEVRLSTLARLASILKESVESKMQVKGGVKFGSTVESTLDLRRTQHEVTISRPNGHGFNYFEYSLRLCICAHDCNRS